MSGHPSAEHQGVNVSIDARRWDVYVAIRDHFGVLVTEYVISADSGLTQGDGVFFGTRDEYEDRLTETLGV